MFRTFDDAKAGRAWMSAERLGRADPKMMDAVRQAGMDMEQGHTPPSPGRSR